MFSILIYLYCTKIQFFYVKNLEMRKKLANYPEKPSCSVLFFGDFSGVSQIWTNQKWTTRFNQSSGPASRFRVECSYSSFVTTQHTGKFYFVNSIFFHFEICKISSFFLSKKFSDGLNYRSRSRSTEQDVDFNRCVRFSGNWTTQKDTNL